ncbi:hypothetical protein PT974_03173 [Cladobotryum mycophilum]|uniref:Bacteriocin-protection protein n=1 Tax=Cladobotryum mycophilum TaxID=491253 RepID=A0ABR0SSR6_9HYPO
MSTMRATRSSTRLAAAAAMTEETTVTTTTPPVASTARRSKTAKTKSSVSTASPATAVVAVSTKTSTASKSSTTKASSSKSTKLPSAEPETIPFADISAFDAWLSSSGASTPSGIWLKISKKASGIPSISYLEAVDTALCHGWIDGMRKSLDASFFLQRFTPRRRKSLWSQRNVERVDAAKEDGRWEKAYAGPGKMETPRDFEEALAVNEAAKIMFGSLTKSQRYPFLWRIETVKRAETRKRKIEQFVELLAEGKTL